MQLRRVHLYNSRKKAFGEDQVLQENIVFHAVKSTRRRAKTIIACSEGPDQEMTEWEVSPGEIVHPADPDQFIHLVTSKPDSGASAKMSELNCSLSDLNLTVSIGRVVEFRSREWLRNEDAPGSVPLIYPRNFSAGWIRWPISGQGKPTSFAVTEESSKWLIPAAVHVLVKRFSAKEERRRISAAVFDPARVGCQMVALENHVNYYHAGGKGLPLSLAKGLAVFLNSSLVDSCFRQFNGHTQVNAADLRKLRYPTAIQLEALGRVVDEVFPDQDEIDRLVKVSLNGSTPTKNQTAQRLFSRNINAKIKMRLHIGLCAL
jgi:adenine-specific DNA-methyltransferase